MFKIITLALGLTVPVLAAPKVPPQPKTSVKAAKKPAHSKTIKRLEAVLGRKLTNAEKQKVRALRDAYDRDMARAVGLTPAQMEAKSKAYKAAHKNAAADKDDAR